MSNPFEDIEKRRISEEQASKQRDANQRAQRDAEEKQATAEELRHVFAKHNKVVSELSHLAQEADIYKLLDQYSSAVDQEISISVSITTTNRDKSRVDNTLSSHHVSIHLLKLFVARAGAGIAKAELEKDHWKHVAKRNENTSFSPDSIPSGLDGCLFLVLYLVSKLLNFDLDGPVLDSESASKRDFLNQVKISCGQKNILIDSDGMQINGEKIPQPYNKQTIIQKLSANT